jgi:hypothetical protein
MIDAALFALLVGAVATPVSWWGISRFGCPLALELRPNCEYSDKDLPRASPEARICTYECTFCAHCVETKLQKVCPNCGGGFAPQPIRPVNEWRPGLSLAKRPASTTRLHLSHSHRDIAQFAARLRDIPPAER